MKNFATGYACSLNDLLVRFPYEKLKSIKGTKVQKRNKMKQVFKEGVKAVIQDIIDNNDVFVLPTVRGGKSELRMNKLQGSEFERARQNGKFQDVDFLESLFTGYQLGLFIESRNKNISIVRHKPVYVNKFFKNQITKNTNEGKTYG